MADGGGIFTENSTAGDSSFPISISVSVYFKGFFIKEEVMSGNPPLGKNVEQILFKNLNFKSFCCDTIFSCLFFSFHFTSHVFESSCYE